MLDSAAAASGVRRHRLDRLRGCGPDGRRVGLSLLRVSAPAWQRIPQHQNNCRHWRPSVQSPEVNSTLPPACHVASPDASRPWSRRSGGRCRRRDAAADGDDMMLWFKWLRCSLALRVHQHDGAATWAIPTNAGTLPLAITVAVKTTTTHAAIIHDAVRALR